MSESWLTCCFQPILLTKRRLPASLRPSEAAPACFSEGALPNSFKPGTEQPERDPEDHRTNLAPPNSDAHMDVPASAIPLPPASCSTSTPLGPADFSVLSDEELERQIAELRLELEERDVRIRAFEGYMAQLDAQEAVLAQMEDRLTRVLDAPAQEGSCTHTGDLAENMERGRMLGNRPWPGNAGH